MKRIINSFIFFLCLIPVFTGCEKIDDNNYIKIAENTYSLTDGSYIDYDTLTGNYYLLGIMLYGMTSITAPIIVSFKMYSPTASLIEDGEYTFSSRNKQYAFNNAGWSTLSGTIDIINGTVTVEHDGANYIIDINCTDKDNNKITGHYKGVLSEKNID